ncbi:MFS transporter, partial [uncultured Pseudomonas sp.]
MAIPSAAPASTQAQASTATPLVMRIIGFCALAHLINDLIQSVLPAIYPMLKANYDLSFAQIGMITLTFQITASLLQPWVGFFTDRRPTPNLLPMGTVCTLIGIVLL